jgi:flagellar biogenesis protein FliO
MDGMNSNKKIVILSVLVVLMLLALKMVSSKQKEPVGTDANSLLNLLNEEQAKPALTVGSNNNGTVSDLFYKMIFMVLAVVVLGGGAVYLSKKLLPKLNLPGKRIQLTETIHLGPRKSLHLVKIGKKTLLLGSTNDNITSLADVSDEMEFDPDGELGEN